jgi:hypothetical protein
MKFVGVRCVEHSGLLDECVGFARKSRLIRVE